MKQATGYISDNVFDTVFRRPCDVKRVRKRWMKL